MASSQGAAQQVHALFQQQADGAAEAATTAPADEVVTHPSGQSPQEAKADFVQQQQQKMEAFFGKQAKSAAEAAKHAPSDQEVTHSMDPEVLAAPDEVTRADFQ